MAGNPLKFRCYQCNQLLGVSRSKVGSVVSCPKCQAGLIVPDPLDEAAASENKIEGAFALTTGAGTLEAGIPVDLIDIRPEDIRVEPGINWSKAGEIAPDETALEPLITTRDQPSAPVREEAPPKPNPASTATVSATSPAVPEVLRVPEVVDRDEELVVPPINFDASGRSTPRATAGKSRDLILPRSVVAAWSLFVLIAQALAFVAGLLAGHFLWKVH